MASLLIAVLALEVLLGTWLGAVLGRCRPRVSTPVVLGFALYVMVCVVFATIAVQYSGPSNRYAAGSDAEQIRALVIGPAQGLWFFGPAVSAFIVGYLRARRPGICEQRVSLSWYLGSILISCLFLPLWFAGIAVHAAHYAGAWL